MDLAGLEPATSRVKVDNPPPSARTVADEVWGRKSALPAELQVHLSVRVDGVHRPECPAGFEPAASGLMVSLACRPAIWADEESARHGPVL